MHRKNKQGTLAERLGNGLQNRVEQFDSARYLNKNLGKVFSKVFCFPYACHDMTTHVFSEKEKLLLHIDCKFIIFFIHLHLEK